jgi:hypothetical protein
LMLSPLADGNTYVCASRVWFRHRRALYRSFTYKRCAALAWIIFVDWLHSRD